MRSLSAHLREPAHHGRLSFHPDCPICCEQRLVGVLPPDAVVGVRTQAALAAGVLAFSSAAPAVAFAAEGDQEQVGSAPPGLTDGTDPALNPDFDPGGNSTDLPADAPPVPQAQVPQDPSNDDAGPVDADPTSATDAPVVDQGDGSVAPTAGEAQPPAETGAPGVPQPSSPAAAEEPAPAPTPSAEPSPTAAAPPAPSADETTPSVGAAPRVHEHKAPSRRRIERVHRAYQTVRQQVAGAPRSAPAAATTLARPETVPTNSSAAATVATGRHAERRDRTHVVVAGESLWSIASDLLGRSASQAAIGREVHRLWELNRERIGTGTPDLLMVGTRLVLR